MAHNNGIISAPVSFADVNAVLGTSHTDLAALCKDTNIKAWAKFKPVRCRQSGVISTVDQLSNGVWNESLSTQWWRDTGTSAQVSLNCYFGLKAVSTTSLAGLYNLRNNEWEYQRPNGGIASPYRLTDFHQYNHNAPTPSGKFVGDTQLILQNTGDGGWALNAALLDIEGEEASLSQRDYVTPADVLKYYWGVDTVYFGFAVFDSSGTAKIWVTGNRYTGAGTNYLSKGTTYTVMCFYSSQPLPEDFSINLNGTPASIPSGTQFAKVPYTSTYTLTTQAESGGTTTIKGRYIITATLKNSAVTVTAKISAVSDGSYTYTGGTFTNVTVYVCKGNFDPSSQTAQSGDIIKQDTTATVSINSGQYWSKTVTANVGTNESVACYLFEDGVKRVMAYARISQDGGITPELV